MTVHNYTSEKLKALNSKELSQLRQNALTRTVMELVFLCDAEILERTSKNPAQAISKESQKLEGFVTEYHFVCHSNEGVKCNSDGTFFSRSWAVSEQILKRSIKHGTRLYLHSARAEPSYRQGKVVAYKNVQALGAGKVRDRIEFCIESDDQTGEWFGNATGERGYRWND